MIFLASTVAEMKATPAVPNLTAIVFGEPYDLPPAVVALSPEVLRSRAGRYRAPSGAEVAVRAVEGGLEATGSEPAGFALLAGVPAAERERYERLGARTADIAGRSFKGDPTGIHEALGGRLGLEQIRQQEAELMRDREERLGPFRGFALVDASPYGEGRVETAVRVDFERGSVYNRFLWGPRRWPRRPPGRPRAAGGALRPGIGAGARGLPPRRRRRPAAARLVRGRGRRGRPRRPGPGRPRAPAPRALRASGQARSASTLQQSGQSLRRGENQDTLEAPAVQRAEVRSGRRSRARRRGLVPPQPEWVRPSAAGPGRAPR